MSRFSTPSASRRARQKAIAKRRKLQGRHQAFIDPDYEAKKTRRKLARASRRANR